MPMMEGIPISIMARKVDIGEFHTHFNSCIKSIEAIRSQDDKRNAIAQLKKEVEAVAHLLPSYQQLSYSEAIKRELESLDKPKTRFRFTQRSRQPEPNRKELKKFEDSAVTPTVTGVKGTHLTLGQSNVLLTELDSCTVRIKNASTVALKSVNNCAFVVECSGPVFIQTASSCLFFISCHQLRLHGLSNCQIDATIPSGRAVIENCHGLQVHGVEIDDFDYPNGKSPNFTLVQFDHSVLNRREAILQMGV